MNWHVSWCRIVQVHNERIGAVRGDNRHIYDVDNSHQRYVMLYRLLTQSIFILAFFVPFSSHKLLNVFGKGIVVTPLRNLFAVPERSYVASGGRSWGIPQIC